MDIDYDKIEHYLAVIVVGHGMGSYFVSKTDALTAINQAVKIAKADWKIKGVGYVKVYDVTHSERWTQSYVPRDIDTKKPLPFLYAVKVSLSK